jgi:hypothetical protein
MEIILQGTKQGPQCSEVIRVHPENECALTHTWCILLNSNSPSLDTTSVHAQEIPNI